MENSRGAVEQALKSPARGIEVDLRMLGDGTVVLHHDETLLAPPSDPEKTGHEKKVLASLTWEDFRRQTPHESLRLSDFLQIWSTDKRAILECKDHRNNASFRRRLLLTLGPDPGDRFLMLSSTSVELLADLSLRSSFPLAPIIWEQEELRRWMVKPRRWSELHLRKELCRDPFLQRVRDRFPCELIAWTVNTEEERKRLEDLAMNGIMTDNHELLAP